MQLLILGSGTAIPLKDRSSSSIALLMEEKIIIFDIGPCALGQFAKSGLNYENVNQILVTHFHPDHTAGIIHFLFATKNPSVIERRKPFTLVGPKGTEVFISRLQDAYYPHLTLPAGIMKIVEFDPPDRDEKYFHGLKINACLTNHTPESIAYRVESKKGESFVYSGDTGFCDEIVELATGVDLLFLECSFPDDMKNEGHLTPSLAGRIAHLAGARRLVLTHFYPQCLKTDIASHCRRHFKGELTLASDLLGIRI